MGLSGDARAGKKYYFFCLSSGDRPWLLYLGARALEYAHVLGELKTAEVCLEAVKQHGWALQHVPKEVKAAELCFIAVKQNAGALQFVPKALREEVRRRLEGGE